MEKKPIESQKEADNVMEFLIKVTMDKMDVDRVQAGKRIANLLDSGVLNGLTPNDTQFHMAVDRYMSTPVI
jgi:hypothetical protein